MAPARMTGNISVLEHSVKFEPDDMIHLESIIVGRLDQTTNMKNTRNNISLTECAILRIFYFSK